MARSKTKQGGAQAPIRGYDNWTIGELRQKLARRTPEELESLLDYEKGGRKRKGALDAIRRVIDESGGGASKSRKSSGGSRKSSRAKQSSGGINVEKIRGGASNVMDRMRSGVESGMKKMRELVGMPEESLGSFSRERFMNRLSEFLEHERNGAKLYELGLQKNEVTDLQRERLEEFYAQTKRHIDILTSVIMALGGEPDSLSEAAELNRQKGLSLVENDVEGEVGLLNYFQNLMIAEFVDHMNWEFLTKVKSKIDDEEVCSVLDEHIENIEDEEDEHYRWAMKQVENLSMLDAFSGSGEEVAEQESSESEEEGEDSDEEVDDSDEDAA